MQADNFPQSKVRGGQCYHLLLQSPLTLPQKSKHSSRFCLVPSLPYTLSNSINLLKNKQKKTKQTNKQLLLLCLHLRMGRASKMEMG